MEPSEGIWKFEKGIKSIIPTICTQETTMGRIKCFCKISGVSLAQLLLGLALQNLPQALFSFLPQNQFVSKGKLGLDLRETSEELSDCA